MSDAPGDAARRVVPIHGHTQTLYDPQARACAACGVREFALFGALDEAALGEIHYHIADLALEPGDSLYQGQASGTALFTVRSGVVRLERLSDNGQSRILRLAGRGDLIGQEALLHQSYAADAVACTPVQACRIPRVLIDELLGDHPELARALMKRWQRALDDADEWMTELSSGSARHRMLRLLLKLGETSDTETVWLPTRQQMGAMLDMTLETASRLVSTLRREGVLEDTGPGIARLHMDKLLQALKSDAAAA
jgi:CRP/FNR family transcriptional regulator, anaerobic regulatory protein